VLKDMKTNGKHAPDEVMYNSLLSGCAKEHRPDEAMQILSDMKKSGVAPSNYTLSMLVKLMGRCKRLNQAFVMLDDISKEYGLKINIQVYTCLIQGCFNGGQASKAIGLHEKIIKEGLQPDAMTYTVLVRGCLQSGMTEQAVELVKVAYGLSTEMPMSKAAAPGLAAGRLEEVMSALGGAQGAHGKALTAVIGNGCVASAGAGARRDIKNGGATAARPPWRSTNYATGAATGPSYTGRSTAKKMAEKSTPSTGRCDW